MAGLPETAEAAARKAGSLVKENFRKAMKVRYKDTHNIVTDTDKQAEEIILGILRREFPSHSYFSEEIGFIRGVSDCLWVIDPVDGTTNFSQGYPHFCISIAFCYNNSPVFGIVYDPIHNELFCATRGSGAFLNKKKISVTSHSAVAKAVILLNRGASLEEKMMSTRLYSFLVPRVRTIRQLGATALDLCHIACGRFDAMINSGCEHYDCAAGNLIAAEAGAGVTDFSGIPWKLEKSDLLVANAVLHEQLIIELKNFSRQ